LFLAAYSFSTLCVRFSGNVIARVTGCTKFTWWSLFILAMLNFVVVFINLTGSLAQSLNAIRIKGSPIDLANISRNDSNLKESNNVFFMVRCDCPDSFFRLGPTVFL
jgi:hypothetical protein